MLMLGACQKVMVLRRSPCCCPGPTITRGVMLTGLAPLVPGALDYEL